MDDFLFQEEDGNEERVSMKHLSFGEIKFKQKHKEV